MTKQSGIIKLQGSFEGFTFYRAFGKDLVRRTYGPSRKKIMTDPAFARTKQNITEFGGCSRIAKEFRMAFVQVRALADGQYGNRLIKLFKTVVVNSEGPRGQRPLSLSKYRGLFKDFECNEQSKLGSALKLTWKGTHDNNRKQASIVINTGKTSEIKSPEGATHMRVVQILGVVSDYAFDKDMGGYLPVHKSHGIQNETTYSDYFSLELKNFPRTTLTSTLSSSKTLPETLNVVQAFGVVFYQKVGTVYYALKSGNALSVMNVF